MRLVTEHADVPAIDSGRGDLLSLGWSGLGKLVQIESLSLMSLHFEEMAMAEDQRDSACEISDERDGLLGGDAA